MPTYLKVSLGAASTCGMAVSPATNTLSLKRRLMVKLVTATRTILALARPEPFVVINWLVRIELALEVVKPRTHVVMVFVGHLAIRVV